MGELLQQLAEREKTSRYVDGLLQAYAKVAPNRQSCLVEPLSPRELEVMKLLMTSLPVPEIADELILSPNTVRSHIKNIYGKLGVNRRLDAIEKAKELRLV